MYVADPEATADPITVILMFQYDVLCTGYNELMPTTFEALVVTFTP